MAVKEKIKTLLDKLNAGIFEKEDVMALALLSSIMSIDKIKRTDKLCIIHKFYLIRI